MIDLHLHTTMSDGLHSPEELAARASAAGLSIVAATDHDTMNGVPALERAAARLGLRCVPGIEITSVFESQDVHILGYFLDYRSRSLVGFLSAQRDDRIRRARLIGERLAALGAGIDIEQLIESSGARPVCRPAIAQVLLDAGRVRSLREAFDRFIGERKPAYVRREGVTPELAIDTIVAAGGIASMAHPGRTGLDRIIPALVRAGLGAIEVYHTDHSAEESARYLEIARSLDLGVTGGTDYHGMESLHLGSLGSVTLPAADFEDLCQRPRRVAELA